jgi:GT2 family glycosyltransferase
MSKTLIGVVSYGGIRFLELFVRSVQETLTKPNTDLLIVVAKPGDSEMVQWCRDRNFRHIVNEQNIGFAGSINDIYDAGFVDGDYDQIVFAGNDVVCLPDTLDHMIETAESTGYDVLCGAEFDVRFLVNTYPEARQYFQGDGLELKDFSTRPWEIHKERLPKGVTSGAMSDVRNLTLFKRRTFDLIGYDNVSYWPNSYFCDNEINRKCGLAGVKVASLPFAAFYHAWSRTIHQGENRSHGKYFERNRQFYVDSWGGLPGQEIYTTPFNGGPYKLGDILLPPTLEIPDRDLEPSIIRHWASLP